MFFNTAATKILQKKIRGRVVRGESFVEFLPDGRSVAQSGLTEEAMAASDWEVVELD